jgi:hypothetical protein
MTWVYFDESGEHDRTSGRLTRLTLGCGIASFDQWKSIDGPWRRVLEDAGVSMFHMADFEARKPPYDLWDDAKRKDVLNKLLNLMCESIPVYWGVSDFSEEIPTTSKFRKAYQSNVIKLFLELVRKREELSGDITCVFARHKNISAQFVGRFFDFFEHWLPNRLKFGGFGEPSAFPQLQVADIIAYEFSRTARKDRPEEERYPLRRLAKSAHEVTLYHSSRFGLDHYEWGQSQLRRDFEP